MQNKLAILIGFCWFSTAALVVQAEDAWILRVRAKKVFTTPIEWIGDAKPSEAESIDLLSSIAMFETNGVKVGFAALEAFVTTHTNSAWSASLHCLMAEHYLHAGRYTLALSHWEESWKLSKDLPDPVSKGVAARSLAGWTRLLGSLGRKQELDDLFAQGKQRNVERSSHSSVLAATMEGLATMKRNPGVSYRCGSYALCNVIKKLTPTNSTWRAISELNSPEAGFSMADLVGIAMTNGYHFSAAYRPPGGGFVVPSIVHWNVNHYAAILEKNGGSYLVADATFGKRQWIDAETLEAEASGNFLVRTDDIPSGWLTLTTEKASLIHGKGNGNDAKDNQDDGPPPPINCPVDPPEAGDGAGAGGGEECPEENGVDSGTDAPASDGAQPASDAPAMAMAIWRVSEPYISLWLRDTPLFYKLSSGRRAGLTLNYRHRAIAKDSTVAGFGDRWDCNWIQSIDQESTNDFYLKLSTHGGGYSEIATNGTPEYKSSYRMTNENGALVLHGPYGDRKEYGFTEIFLGGQKRYYLTNVVDPYGRTVQYSYEIHTNLDTTTMVRLKEMKDIDGRICTLSYSNTSFPGLITSVVDPYSRSATFVYDATNRLVSITDMAGLVSAFSYNSNGIVTNLNTAYGNTGFKFYEGTNALCTLNRALEVTEPNGARQLYAYRDASSDTMIGTYYTADGYGVYRNSYHWNRLQYDTISHDGKTNYIDMPAADYRIASLKHWLHGELLFDEQTVVNTLAAAAGPIADTNSTYRVNGVYWTYQGQDLPYVIGTSRTVTGIYSVTGDVTLSPRNSWGRPEQFSYYRNGDFVSYTNEFDADGRILLKVWGPSGELVRGYGYHPSVPRLLTSVTNAVGDVLRFTHDAKMKVTSITTPSGLVTTNIYYSGGDTGFLQARIQIGFTTNSFAYSMGNLASKTDTLGLATSYTHDNLNRLTSVGYPDSTTISNVYTYLDLTGVKDRATNWQYFSYNSVRQLLSATRKNGQVTQFEYCDCGSLSTITASNGPTSLVTHLTHDIAGRLTVAVYPDGFAKTNIFDAYSGHLLRTDDSSGRSVHFSYGADNSVTSIGLSQLPNTYPDGYIIQRVLDKYNRPITVTDRDDVSSYIEYDVLGRLTTRVNVERVTWGEIGAETNVYSARGLVAHMDAMNHTNFYVYDAKGRLLHATNVNNEVLSYTYNAANELLSLTDGKSQTTSWIYDEYGRVIRKVDAASHGVFTNAYDTLGRLISHATPAKGVTLYGYDVMGNLTNVDYPGTISDITYAYDLLGQLTNMVDAVGTTRFSYTPAGQLSMEDGPWNSDTIAYSYDSRRQSQLSLSQPNASAWMQTYAYDAYGRLTNTYSPAGNFKYIFAALMSDNVSQVDFPSGSAMSIVNQYDLFGRLTYTGLSSPAYVSDVDGHGYQYNAISQRTQQGFEAENYIDYAYDGIGQLISASGKESDNSPRLNEQFSYSYDAAWNLQSRTNNALVQTFSVDSLNQLSGAGRSGTLTVAGNVSGPVTTVSINGSTNSVNLYQDGTFAKSGFTVTNGNNFFSAVATDTYGRTDTHSVTFNLPSTVTYLYDGNGNLTNDGLRNFEYDSANQLTNVYVTGNWRSESRYDGLSRRKLRTEYAWQSSAWVKTNEVRYIYDNGCVVQERNGNNTPVATYTRGLDISSSLEGAGGIGGLLGRTDNLLLNAGNSLAHAYYHSDGNGNVTCLANRNGTVVARYNYDPYGNVLSMSGSLAAVNLYGFASKEYDSKSGLSYFLYRLYDSHLQRWINKDPIQEEGGINLFQFATADPINGVDNFGLSCWTKAAKVWKAIKKERELVKDITGKDGKKTMEEIKKALDGIDTRGGAKRGVTASNVKSREEIAKRLSDNGKARPQEKSHGYPSHQNPEQGKYKDVHVESGLMMGIAGALAPQAKRLSEDPEAEYSDLVLAGLWDAVSTVDPIFLTDAIEKLSGCRIEDF